MRETTFTCVCGYVQKHKPSGNHVAIPFCTCGKLMRIKHIDVGESTRFEILLGMVVAVFALYGFTDLVWRIL